MPAAPGARPRRLPWSREATLLLIPCALAILAYLPAVGDGFVWDDVSYLVINPAAHDLSRLGEALGHGFTWVPAESPGEERPLYYYRPVVTIANTLGWVVSGGRPGLFHAQNVLAHAGTTLMLCLLAVWLGLSPQAALVLGSAFALHPAISEAVAWISGRTDGFAAFFSLAALLLLVGWRTGRLAGWRWTLAAFGVATFLALASKESAAFLVVLAPLLILLPRPDGVATARPPLRLGRGHALAALLFAAGLYLAVRSLVSGLALPSTQIEPANRLSLFHRLVLSGNLFLAYVQNLVAPWRLVPEPAPWLLRRPPALLTGLIGITMLATIGLFWLLGVRAWAHHAPRKWVTPAGAVGLGIFLLTLVPVLQWIQTGEVYGQRFLYLPLAGLFLWMGSVVDPWLRGAPRRSWWLLGIVGAVLIVLLQRQLPIWKDEYALFRATAEARPQSARALANLGTEQFKRGLLNEAEVNLAMAVQLDPGDGAKHGHYGALLMTLGRREEGVRQLELARANGDRSQPTLRNLGIGWVMLGRYEDGARALREAMNPGARDAALYEWLGLAERKLGRAAEAAGHLRRSIELDAAREPAWRNLMGALAESGQPEEAQEVRRAFLRQFPGSPEAKSVRGVPGGDREAPAAPGH
jgi:protein O-mannosyl-transferase